MFPKPIYIKKEDLIAGGYYKGSCRNARIARWNGKVFLYWRIKFVDTFLEEIHCPEDDQIYDVFYAEEFLCNPTCKEIPLNVD